MSAISTIIFVHGAWANASGWNKVLPLLEDTGLELVAVSTTLASLAADAAIVRRAIAIAKGPALLVGHSYGGAVITEAGLDPKVAGLVYVAAFAPDAGETVLGLGAEGPPNDLPNVLVPDDEGFLKLSRRGVDEVFAQDLPLAERNAIFQTQGPTAAAALSTPITVPAWKEKPSWFLRATLDNTIHPELQAMMAKRMEAITVDTDSSHLPMLSQPHKVSDLILLAMG
ncbi:alpha/beta hydrolase [Sphingomonas sp. AR_OL41]|uniref:alpha/beta fold hydrolase n=1 Tax=Sphingomonas sp. AR_OL41 TaxID=3042729 RepID=UPI0024800FF6|nr:alpha/beta hydrolase [Sphingomonas sp. AR_OL41]MDH7973889.1 alpha/beta hydrolase [Sphingomonas sp. AR_OL41]